MFDAVNVIIEAFNRLIKKKADVFRSNLRRGEVYNNGTKGIDCRRPTPATWEHGEKIIRAIKKVEMEGLTGNIVFDEEGLQTNYTLDVVEMTVDSHIAKVGVWSEERGFQPTSPKYVRIKEKTKHENKTYIVTTILVSLLPISPCFEYILLIYYNRKNHT